jgi:hypothetical protein
MVMQHTGPLTNRIPQRQRMSSRGRRIAKRIALTIFIVVASLSALVWARFRPAILPPAAASSSTVTSSILAEPPAWGTAMVSTKAPSTVSDGASAVTKKTKGKGKAQARAQRNPGRSVAQQR